MSLEAIERLKAHLLRELAGRLAPENEIDRFAVLFVTAMEEWERMKAEDAARAILAYAASKPEPQP